MYLVDTNVWLERILDQKRAGEVRDFMREVEGRFLAITEFSIYSVGVILSRLKKREACADFLLDTVEDSGLLRIRLDTRGLLRALEVCELFRLDFDDAYQYVAAEKHNLTLVSFDTDFDRTERGRKTPADGLGEPPIARDAPATKPPRRRSRKP
jgi:predicted nucleic acid-binding protein